MVLNRPLLFSLGLVALSACAGALGWVFHAPEAGAALAASSAPGVVITLYEALRTLNDPVDDADTRSACLALGLLCVPILTLLAAAWLFDAQPRWHMSA